MPSELLPFSSLLREAMGVRERFAAQDLADALAAKGKERAGQKLSASELDFAVKLLQV